MGPTLASAAQRLMRAAIRAQETAEARVQEQGVRCSSGTGGIMPLWDSNLLWELQEQLHKKEGTAASQEQKGPAAQVQGPAAALGVESAAAQ